MSKKYGYQQLLSFAENIFLKIGCSAVDAKVAARSLLVADVRGVDSHGVARLSGYVRLWGTNPIAVAIPAGKEPAFVADFATTTASNGKLEILQRKNSPAPEGWVQTKDGKPSTNAGELKNGGSLLPLGGDREHGSHKGY